MKIVSKYKDYYDSVSHQYLDKEILYIREQSTVDLKGREYPRLHNFDVCYYVPGKINSVYKYFSLRIVGFCGHFYPVILASDGHDFDPKVTIGFYNFEEFKQYALLNRIPIRDGTARYRRWTRWGSYYSDTLQDIEAFFSEREHYDKLDKFFSAHNTPVFSLYLANQQYKLTVNPLLKKYSFMKMKDPFSAHQELYQFVGGYLKQPTNPMVNISDKDKIHKHGFDKWSFRQKGPKK